MFRLYDTRHRKVVSIEPARRGELRMYSCGPAVDRYAHAGNLRSYLLADLIRRTAQRHRLTVISCQNITDLRHPEIARHYEGALRADCAALNIYPADSTPRASESTAQMTGLIGRLIEAGHAYPSPDGSVFFDARSFPGYGEISGSRREELPPEPGPGAAVDPRKRFHADWALWQGAAAGGELTWPAPWGTGFPGCDTQCSAMSLHELGEVIDIHTGSIDLRFPHHENERAQSDSVTGHEVVRHWVHGEHLLFDGRAMAGSTGNVVLVADVAARGLDPLALRLALLEHSYRQPMNLTWETLAAAGRTLRRWRERVAEWANSPSKPMCAQYTADITGAFDDDLDTPAALLALRGLEEDDQIPPGSKFETFAGADALLGLDLARDVGRPPRPGPGGRAA